MEDNFEIDFSDIADDIVLNDDKESNSDNIPDLKEKGDNMPINAAHAFNESLESLSTVTGFLASGIYNSSGDVLAHLDRKNFKFEEIGSLAIELYTAAKSISEKMGIGICNFVETHTEGYIFIHMCVVPGKGAMGVLLSADGNVGLSRHQMRKEGLKLVPEFE